MINEEIVTIEVAKKLIICTQCAKNFQNAMLQFFFLLSLAKSTAMKVK